MRRLKSIGQGRAIPTTGLRQVRAATAAAAAALGDSANELAGLELDSDHLLAEGRHQDHLAHVARIRQTADHHGRTIPQLIRQALGCTLQTSAIHAVEAFHQQLEAAHGLSLGDQSTGLGHRQLGLSRGQRLAGGLELLLEGCHTVNDFGRLRLEAIPQLLHHCIALVQISEHGRASDSFNPANAGRHATFRHDLEQTDLSSEQRRDRRQQLIEDFHLSAFINRLGFQLSGGERRRCEVARALASGANGPTYLLLDEPFAGVDPLAVADLQLLIEGLRSRGMGILITDHNVRETLATTDRAYILNDGAVLAAGRSDEVAADPQVRRYYLGEGFQL